MKHSIKCGTKCDVRRMVAFLLAGVLLCTAASCGVPGGVQPDGREEQTQESIGQGDALSPVSGNAAAQAEKASQGRNSLLFPYVTMETIRGSYTAKDGETVLGEVARDNVVLDYAASGTGAYQKGAATVERLFSATQEAVDEEARMLGTDAVDQYEAMKQEAYGYFSPYSEWETYTIARLDRRVLSLQVAFYEYVGGVHGYGGTRGVTIDLLSGTELSLAQLAQDPTGFLNRTTEVILAELDTRQEELFDGYTQYVMDNLEQVSWYLDAVGIEFAFTPYEIGPYASGTIVVCVPYEQVAEFMKPEYVGIQEMGIAHVPAERAVSLSYMSKGEQGTFSYRYEYPGQYETDLVLSLDAEQASLGDVYMDQCYLIDSPDEKLYLLYDVDMASDDYVTYLYDLTDGALTEGASVAAKLDGKNMGVDWVNLKFSLYVLGTYSSEMKYLITADGALVGTEDRFEVPYHSAWNQLKLVRDLPVTMEGVETVLPAGSSIYIMATDNDSIAWFETVDGKQSGEIHYERSEEDYLIYIDGLSEFDYFDSLPYVG